MTLENPLTISVVIPLFNKVDHVRQAIESVLGQSRRPQEILVIDDGSTDGGDLVVQEYAPSVTLIRRPHAGVSAARNFGIEIAKGEVVAFLDADDAWKPRFLEKVTALLERFPHVCAAGSTYEYLIEPGQVSQLRFAGVPGHAWQGIIDYFACMAANGTPPIHSSAVVARRMVLRQIGGFPLGIRWGEDHDTWARLALAGDIAFTTETLATLSAIAANRATDSKSPRPPLPAIATITKALKSTKDDKRRADFKKYLRKLAFISPITNLRYGHSSLARSQLISHRTLTGLGPLWFTLMFCSFLPQPSVRMIVRLRRVAVVRLGEPHRAQLQW